MLADDAGVDVGGSAGAERHDDLYGPRRIVLRRGGTQQPSDGKGATANADAFNMCNMAFLPAESFLDGKDRCCDWYTRLREILQRGRRDRTSR